jgi:alpha-beta hydrolase superfamily lysophospholipase
MTPFDDDARAAGASVDRGITRDGLQQLRRRWSPTDVPTAAVLLIHGLGEHCGRYDHVGRWLADAGYDVVAIDQRGFGESGGRRAHVRGFDDFLDDVEDQLREVRSLGVPVVLLGHSMGGLVCADYATSDRPQPDLLVLSGPALGATVEPVKRLVAPLLGRIAPRLRVRSRIDGEVLCTDPAVGEAYLADPLVVSYVSARLGASLIARGPEVTARLDRLQVPALVLHGGDDRLVPTDASRPFEGRPGVERVVLAGLRHEILNEPGYPDVLVRIVDWIESRLAEAAQPS